MEGPSWRNSRTTYYLAMCGHGQNCHRETTACDQRLFAWELVKALTSPEMRALNDFDEAYPALKVPSLSWLSNLEMALHNAGVDDPRYFEERLRFMREQAAHFPENDDNGWINLRWAEGEALWLLWRQAEAEAVFQALIEPHPDQGWAYIGWADQYNNQSIDQPKDYPRAEAILLQGMARPNLQDHRDLVGRLIGLYENGANRRKSPHWNGCSRSCQVSTMVCLIPRLM